VGVGRVGVVERHRLEVSRYLQFVKESVLLCKAQVRYQTPITIPQTPYVPTPTQFRRTPT
jgi:hypothetical protein